MMQARSIPHNLDLPRYARDMIFQWAPMECFLGANTLFTLLLSANLDHTTAISLATLADWTARQLVGLGGLRLGGGRTTDWLDSLAIGTQRGDLRKIG